MGLLKLLFGKKVKNILEEAVDVAKDDKELQQAFGDLGYHTDMLELRSAEFHIVFPDSERFKYKSDAEIRILNENYEKLLKEMCKKYPDDKELLKKLQEIS